MDIIDVFQPIVNKLVNKYKNVPGFDYQILKDEIETGKRGILDMIMEYTPEKAKGAPLAGYINKFLSRRAIEAANRNLDTDFKLDVTEAKGVTDTTTEEVTERVEEVDKPKIESLRKKMGIGDEIKPVVFDAVRKTFGTKIPEVSNKNFRKELEKSFRVELKKPIAKLMGRTEAYRSFLANNFETIYDALPQSVINRRLNEFAEPVMKDGKQVREKTAEGKKVFTKKKIAKAEWIKYFLGSDVGRSTQGTRKTALAEALAETFALDATMEVLSDPEVLARAKGVSELLGRDFSDNFIDEVSKVIDRPVTMKFSKTAEKAISADTIEVESGKSLKPLLKNYGVKPIPDVKTFADIPAAIDAIRNHIIPLGPKEMWFGKPNKKGEFGSAFTRSYKIFGLTSKKTGDMAVWQEYSRQVKQLAELPDSYFGKPIKGVSDYSLPSYSTLFKDTETIIKNIENGKIAEFNERMKSIHAGLWGRINEAIRLDKTKDKKTAAAAGLYFKMVGSDTNHWHKMGAEFVGYSSEITGARYEYEHAMPATQAYIYLLDASLAGKDFVKAYKGVMDNYKLIALDKAQDKKITKAGLQRRMPKDWVFGKNLWWQRYFNNIVSKIDDGIDPNSIIFTDGQTAKQKFRVEADGINYDVQPQPSNIKYSKSLDTEFNQLLQATTGIEYYKEFSPAKARLVGIGKGKRKFFIPYSADDFVGLLYATLGKGKVGDKQMAWYEENLLRPFSRGIQQYEVAKQKAMREWMALSSQIKKDVPGGLNKRNETGFRNQDSLRMYIWAKQSMDVPGAAKSDINESVSLVNNNPKLKEFAERLIALNPEGYPAPGQSWDAGDITTDIVSYVNDVRRGEFLTEWKENVDQIFTDKNKTKVISLIRSKLC